MLSAFVLTSGLAGVVAASGDILDQMLDMLNRIGVLSAFQTGMVMIVALFIFRSVTNR